MKINEFKGPRGFALGITDAPSSVEDMQQSFRHIKQALLEWREKRGAACELVMFTYVAHESLHDPIANLLTAVYSEEQQLAPVLQSVSIQVNLLNGAGKKVREFGLGIKKQPQSAQAKPWWKFW